MTWQEDNEQAEALAQRWLSEGKIPESALFGVELQAFHRLIWKRIREGLASTDLNTALLAVIAEKVGDVARVLEQSTENDGAPFRVCVEQDPNDPEQVFRVCSADP